MLNIVVIEDNPPLRESLVEVLAATGHHVVAFDSAESFASNCSVTGVDIMILDLNLPGEDGISLAGRMRRLSADMGIIMLTARGTPVTTVASTPTAVDFRAAHVRRKDAAAAGLTYTVQFSAGDGSWTSSTDTPTVVASDSEVEVVTVKYPLFLNGKKARFFRVVVSAP